MLHFDGKMSHYHDFSTENGRLVDVSQELQIRAHDIHMSCVKLGAKSVVDIGSYYGGILFLLDQQDGYERLVGLEKRKDFFDRATTYKASISSKVDFLNIDFSQFAENNFDVAVIQNVYHYLFGENGSHEAVFAKLSKMAKNVLWYNPVTVDDKFLIKYMEKNPSVEWARYNEDGILTAARKEGFLVQPDTSSRYNGMGQSRKHYVFSL